MDARVIAGNSEDKGREPISPEERWEGREREGGRENRGAGDRERTRASHETEDGINHAPLEWARRIVTLRAHEGGAFDADARRRSRGVHDQGGRLRARVRRAVRSGERLPGSQVGTDGL